MSLITTFALDARLTPRLPGVVRELVLFLLESGGLLDIWQQHWWSNLLTLLGKLLLEVSLVLSPSGGVTKSLPDLRLRSPNRPTELLQSLALLLDGAAFRQSCASTVNGTPFFQSWDCCSWMRLMAFDVHAFDIFFSSWGWSQWSCCCCNWCNCWWH